MVTAKDVSAGIVGVVAESARAGVGADDETLSVVSAMVSRWAEDVDEAAAVSGVAAGDLALAEVAPDDLSAVVRVGGSSLAAVALDVVALAVVALAALVLKAFIKLCDDDKTDDAFRIVLSTRS